MKYLLFDENAISTYVSESRLQSIEYQDGLKFIEHIYGRHASEIFCKTVIEYTQDGILFVGKQKKEYISSDVDKHIFCIDLTACALLDEESNPARLLNVIQRAFRLSLKIWNRYPFASSERVNETKSILFPFSITDRHRLVIERSNHVQRLENRGIVFPLLAYKYNDEEIGQSSDIVNTDILRQAGEEYVEKKHSLHNKLEAVLACSDKNEGSSPLEYVEANMSVERDDFIFWGYDRQLDAVTESQRRVIEFESTETPLRIDGAAGTGKTISLIMRAYNLLRKNRENGTPFHIIFFAHSESTSLRNKEVFSLYNDSEYFLSLESDQSIQFTTLLSFCREFAHIEESAVIESDAEDAKTYQLLLIDEVVKNACKTNRIQTYRPIISSDVYSLFDANKTNTATLAAMLQHEFSIQIKGRTDCSIDNYLELEPIPNGIPCKTDSEKQLIFSLFVDYQKMLQNQGAFDVDDVTIEAISHLNAPIWRRKRQNEGYDYILVDEMHLFNLNEQSVFHFLSKDLSTKNIPICFALDYSQAIGDRGNVSYDYIASKSFENIKEEKLYTIFRNSPQIADFCASIAASGTLMFGSAFSNPYANMQYHFTHAEEIKMQTPELYMYTSDDAMISDLSNRLNELIKSLQCKPRDVAIIAFDNKWLSNTGVQLLERTTGKSFSLLDQSSHTSLEQYVLSSPYKINGLEFQAVVLLGVDEGRIPQTTGTEDISKHFLLYSAFNMLYLSASRAKYRVIIMGSSLRGVSSCLEHSIRVKTLHTHDCLEVV